MNKTFASLRLLQKCCHLARNTWAPAKYSSSWTFKIVEPEFDIEAVCAPGNVGVMQENIVNRKGEGDMEKVLKLYNEYQSHEHFSGRDIEAYIDSDHPNVDVKDFLCSEETDIVKLKKKLIKAIRNLPNTTHPEVAIGDESKARLLQIFHTKRNFDFDPKGVVELGHELDCLRTQFVGYTTGQKTYYFKNWFVNLQNALIDYTTDYLSAQGFLHVQVPEIVHPSIIEACGFPVRHNRTQVFQLATPSGEQVCLSGTGEMPLAAYFHNRDFSIDDLPQKVMTVSRCFRAETSGLEEEQGIYRVHQFHKVEMFAVTNNEQGSESQEMMDHLLAIQTDLFSNLGLHLRVLDMPSEELGAPAHRKYDIEAWMPHKKFWGEISSTSNCTDYQSRRLGIRYWDENDNAKFTHTVNGTGCAVPRMIMAIAENFQTKDGHIAIPKALQPYFGAEVIEPPSISETLKWTKLTKAYKERTQQKQ